MNYSVAAVLRAVVSLNLDHFPVNLPLHGSCFIDTEQTVHFRGSAEHRGKNFAINWKKCRLERDHTGCMQ